MKPADRRNTVTQLLKLLGFQHTDEGCVYIAKIILKAWKTAGAGLSGYNQYTEIVASEEKQPKDTIIERIENAINRARCSDRSGIIEYILEYCPNTAARTSQQPDLKLLIQSVMSYLLFCEENSIDVISLTQKLTYEHTNDAGLRAAVTGYTLMLLRGMNCSVDSIENAVHILEGILQEQSSRKAVLRFREYLYDSEKPIIFEGIVIPTELYYTKISDMRFSERKYSICGGLKRTGIIYLRDLRNKSKDDLLGIPHIGKKTYEHFVSVLKQTVEDNNAAAGVCSELF